jgi:8-oxo-dGTP pyrophosphatase MutT (NUDIX family)
MIKIFSLNKTIYLINDQKMYKQKKDTQLVSVHSEKEMSLMYSELIKKNNLKQICFFNESLKQLFSYFSSMFKVIEAAGGLVKNNKGEWLFIFRNGKWDLPKGKVEKKEAVKDAAIREVEEECGISKLSIVKELPATYHTYFMEEKAILKCTYWYEMFCSDDAKLVPQLEEGITDVKWLPENNLKKVIDNTYESVKDVLKEIKKK